MIPQVFRLTFEQTSTGWLGSVETLERRGWFNAWGWKVIKNMSVNGSRDQPQALVEELCRSVGVVVHYR